MSNKKQNRRTRRLALIAIAIAIVLSALNGVGLKMEHTQQEQAVERQRQLDRAIVDAIESSATNEPESHDKNSL